METTESKKTFTVFVDDNFHFHDESERYAHDDFESYEEAVTTCKLIVDRDLKNMYSEDKSAASLYDEYTSFGDDPFVRPVPQRERFSAWGYAKQRCKQIYNLHN